MSRTNNVRQISAAYSPKLSQYLVVVSDNKGVGYVHVDHTGKQVEKKPAYFTSSSIGRFPVVVWQPIAEKFVVIWITRSSGFHDTIVYAVAD